ncbi:MAG: hypothetical protein ABEJ89_00660 [Haloarculaceae archaeon]
MSQSDENRGPSPPRQDLLEPAESDRPHEPEEFDPTDLGPEIPGPPEPGEADRDIVRLFWKLVFVFNVALLALSLGVMMVAFDTRPALGVRVFLVGLVVLAYGLVRYWRFRTDDRDADQNP